MISFDLMYCKQKKILDGILLRLLGFKWSATYIPVVFFEAALIGEGFIDVVHPEEMLDFEIGRSNLLLEVQEVVDQAASELPRDFDLVEAGQSDHIFLRVRQLAVLVRPITIVQKHV